MSGSAGPVTKTIGNNMSNIEKNKTSYEIDLSVNKCLKGSKIKLVIMYKNYTGNYTDQQKKTPRVNHGVYKNYS